jgi:hypothetical protein
MPEPNPELRPLVWKTIVVHTVTYFVIGVISFIALDYPTRWEAPVLASRMRPLDDPLVRAGILFQPLRGLVFALVFYPLRGALFGRPRGWLVLWWTLLGLGILNTFGPASVSIEGMVYTTIPIMDQISGAPEIVVQSAALAAILSYWIDHPSARKLGLLLNGAFAVVIAMAILGLFMGGQ